MSDLKLYEVTSPGFRLWEGTPAQDYRYVRARTRREAVMAAVKDMRRHPSIWDWYFDHHFKGGPPWKGFRANPVSKPHPGYPILSAAEVLAR